MKPAPGLASVVVDATDVPFMVQIWMFATPSIYMQADDAVASRWLGLLPLSPAQGLITNFRLALTGGALDYYSLGISGVTGLVLLLACCLYFRLVERSFADIL